MMKFEKYDIVRILKDAVTPAEQSDSLVGHVGIVVDASKDPMNRKMLYRVTDTIYHRSEFWYYGEELRKASPDEIARALRHSVLTWDRACPTEEELELAREDMEDLGVTGDMPEVYRRGYDIFDYDGTGLLEINQIDCMGTFSRLSENDYFERPADEIAAFQAELDGVCTIIPVSELPEKFNRRYFGWVDTPENRRNIEEYTKKYCS